MSVTPAPNHRACYLTFCLPQSANRHHLHFASEASDFFYRSLANLMVDWTDDTTDAFACLNRQGFQLRPEFWALDLTPVPSSPVVEIESPETTTYVLTHTPLLPSEDNLFCFYSDLPLHRHTCDHLTDLVEIGWGGLSGQCVECVGLHLCYAHSLGWPMTRAAVCKHYTAPDLPNCNDVLVSVDHGFGSVGDS